MNREILFRGKRLDNGEWAYGYYIYKQDQLLPGIDASFIVTFDENSMSVWNKVDPSTVGQYTGLTDRAGKRIFEGDVVELNAALYLVDWLSSIGMFVLRYVSNLESITDFSIIGPERCKVRGNVHDHPELLKGETKNGEN